jgi:hypothetical protein
MATYRRRERPGRTLGGRIAGGHAEASMTEQSRWEVGWLARSAPARLMTAALFGVLLSLTRVLTLPGTLLVILAGVLVWTVDPETEPVAVDEPVPAGSEATGTGVAVWGLVILAFLLWEAGAFFLGNDDAHPTFSTLAEPILGWPPMRAVAGFAWMWWGWQLRSR